MYFQTSIFCLKMSLVKHMSEKKLEKNMFSKNICFLDETALKTTKLQDKKCQNLKTTIKPYQMT